jgi:hypothetical protein
VVSRDLVAASKDSCEKQRVERLVSAGKALLLVRVRSVCGEEREDVEVALGDVVLGRLLVGKRGRYRCCRGHGVDVGRSRVVGSSGVRFAAKIRERLGIRQRDFS